jgi:cytochrome c oxidase subunit III
MATTIQPPKIDQEQRLRPSNSGGGFRNLAPADGNLKAVDDYSTEPARTGIWVGLAAITMSFAAFTSALFVRQSSATDWHHLSIPPIVFLNTLVLLASSVTLEIARKRLSQFMRNKEGTRQVPLTWLGITLGLGLIFVVGQYAAWLKLRAEGLYLATNPNSSFFYVLTAMHALHVLGGLGGLLRVINKLRQPVLTLRRSTMDATSYYWHFMGILWLYVLMVVWIKL